MHSPATGRALTEIIVDGDASFLDVSCLSLSRFAKGELLHGLAQTGTAAINLDDPRIAAQATTVKAKKLTWGRAPEADVRLVSVEPRRADLRRALGQRARAWV